MRSCTKKINIFAYTILVFAMVFSVSFAFFSPLFASAETGVPTPISYQGHLTDSGGNPLGGAGTPYFFKFSLWDSPTVGSGTKVWPTSNPNSTSLSVKQGVFNVNIGDTENGYPDTLDYNWNSNKKVYLQVEISSDNSNFETLSPRSPINSIPFSQVASQVNGVASSSFGTTTPFLNTLISAISTSINSAVLSIKGIAGQVANLFNIFDSNGNTLFTVSPSGNVGIGTTTPGATLHILNSDQVSIPNVLLMEASYASGDPGFEFKRTGGGASGDYFARLRGSGGNTWLSFYSNSGSNKIDQQLIIHSNGNVGINDTSPDFKFETKGTSTLGYFGVSNLGDGDMFIVNSLGNVGIGTTTPANKLDVWGNLSVGTSSTSALFVNTATTNVGIGMTPLKVLSLKAQNTSDGLEVYSSTSAEAEVFLGLGAARVGVLALRNAGSTKINFNANGISTINTGFGLGVGTTTSSTMLDVWGSFSVGTSSIPAFSVNTGSGNVGIGTSVTSARMHIAGSSALGSIGSQSVLLLTRPYNPGINFENQVSFKVGQWATDGSSRLDIGLKGSGGTGSGIDAANNSVMTLLSNGNVGVGTSTPVYPLDVVGKIGINGNQFIYVPGGNFTGTSFIGNGGSNISYTSGVDGKYNTFNGIGSGASLTTGSYNAGFGTNALASITTGQYNMAIGVNSLFSNSTGSSNVGIGYNTLYDATGHYNVAIGATAMRYMVSGAGNTAIGYAALPANTSGAYNVVMGYGVGQFLTSGGENLILGKFAGRYLSDNATPVTSVNNSVYLGSTVYPSAATGITNEIVIGYSAIGNGSNSATLGNDSITKTILKGNVGIGTTSPTYQLQLNDGTSDYFVVDKINSRMKIGKSETVAPSKTLDIAGDLNFDTIAPPVLTSMTLALAGAGTGNVNTGDHYYSVSYYDSAGNESVQEVPTSAFTIANSVTDGKVNITNIPISPDPRVVGRKLYRSTAGGNNTTNTKLLATIANNTTTTYLDNIADASLGAANIYRRNNLTAGRIFADGTMIFAAPSVGFTAAGYSALISVTTGTDNNAFGGSALQSVTSGSNNNAFGRAAAPHITTGSNNNAMGYTALYGNVTGLDNVGIGFSALRSANGTDYSYNVGLGSASLSNLKSASHFNVGVGYNTGNQAMMSAASLGNIFVGAHPNAYTMTNGSYNILMGYNADTPTATTSNFLNIGNTIYGTSINGVSSGNIGIGTTTPTAVLHLKEGTATANTAPLKFTSGALLTTPEAGTIEYLNNSFYMRHTLTADNQTALLGVGTAGKDVKIGSFRLSSADYPGVWLGQATPSLTNYAFLSDSARGSIFNAPTGQKVFFRINNADQMAVGATGVGIGTSTPGSKLDVWGNLNVATGTTPALFVNTATGNVGIGTTAPNTKLQVVGTSEAANGTYYGVVRIDTNSGANDVGFKLGGLAGAGTAGYGFIQGVHTNIGNDLNLSLNPNGGNIGIGTTTPSAQLHTTGTVRFSTFTAGSLQTDANGNLTVSSDEKLKDIQGNFTRGLADLQKINPISYRWNVASGYDTKSIYSGFSAQNIQLAIPEAVSTSSNGYLALSDRPIIATLVNAVKEIGSVFVKIENGIAYIKDVVVEKITSNKICLQDSNGETCITKTQLDAMLLKSREVGSKVDLTPAPEAVSTEPVSIPAPSDEPTQVAPESVPEPEPTSASLLAPTNTPEGDSIPSPTPPSPESDMGIVPAQEVVPAQ